MEWTPSWVVSVEYSASRRHYGAASCVQYCACGTEFVSRMRVCEGLSLSVATRLGQCSASPVGQQQSTAGHSTHLMSDACSGNALCSFSAGATSSRTPHSKMFSFLITCGGTPHMTNELQHMMNAMNWIELNWTELNTRMLRKSDDSDYSESESALSLVSIASPFSVRPNSIQSVVRMWYPYPTKQNPLDTIQMKSTAYSISSAEPSSIARILSVMIVI